MRRLFWLAMGVTIGVLVVRKLSAAAEKMTPGSIGRQIAGGLAAEKSGDPLAVARGGHGLSSTSGVAGAGRPAARRVLPRRGAGA